jgi:AcrR family transcriptional regulator
MRYPAPMHSAASARPLRRDAQANRDRIVDAARAVFASEGIGAPVEEIARRAEVGMGTLYRRFPTKDDLVDAVFEDTLAAIEAAARDAHAADDPWAGFCAFLDRAFALHEENRGLKDVVMTRSEGRAAAESARARLRPLIATIVARAQADGSMRSDFRTEDIPVLFWAVGRVIDATAEVAPGAWRRHLAIVLDGLRARAATPLPRPALTRTQLDRASARPRRNA